VPRPGSTNNEGKDVEYIVRGSSPLYSALSVITFLLIVTAIVLQYLELTEDYSYPPGIFF
jgi:hypothetical protein